MKKERTPKVAIYTRVSTQFQIGGESLPTQRRDLSIYSEHVLNIHDYVVFEEAGYTGKNTNRPAFQEMMDRIRKGEFTHLLVYRIDRISRNVLDFSQMYDELKRLDVTFVSKNEQFDTSSAIGEAILKIILVFAELERKMTSERVYAVLLSRASQGKPTGGHVPFGYNYDKNTQSINVIPEEAEIVKYLFDSYPKFGSLVKLAAHLNEIGIRNRNGNYFSSSTLHELLSNQFYTGDSVYNKRNNSTNKRRPKSEWMTLENHHEAIITHEQFDYVNDILTSKRKSDTPPTYKYYHLFSRMLTCAECGNPYHAHITDPRDDGYKPSIYVCYGRYKKQGVCHNSSVSDVKFAPIIFTFIKNVIYCTKSITERTTLSNLNSRLLHGKCFDKIDHIDEDSLIALKNIILKKPVDYYNPPELIPTPPHLHLSDLQKDRQKQETALTRLMNLYLYDPESLPEKEFILKKEQITERINHLDAEIKKIKSNLSDRDPNEINLESYYTTIDALTKGKDFDFKKYIQSVNPKIPQEFLNRIFSDITVLNGLPDTITFTNGIKIKFIQKEHPAG